MAEPTSVWSSAQNSLIRKWTAAAQEVKAVLESARAAKLDRSKIDNFRGRYTVLEKYYSRFEQYSDALTDLNEDLNRTEAAGGLKFTEFPDNKQTNVLTNIRLYYMECHEIHATLTKIDLSQTVQNITVANEQVGGGSSLPKLNIPKFSGDFEQWTTFRDTFVSMVHTAPALSNTQRFHHLISSLSGVAKSVIANFSISDANYDLAWAALNNAFDNKRVIASCYLNRILDQKPTTGKPSNQSYRDFLSNVGDTIAAFSLLKLREPEQFILFHLAVRALDPYTREQFELGLKKTDFPTVNTLMDFIRTRQLALCLAEPSLKGVGPSSDAPSRPPNKGHKPKGGNVPRTSLVSTDPAPPSKKPIRCVICPESHTLYRCVKFNLMTPPERFQALKKWGGCKVCFSYQHPTKECRSTTRCRLCDKPHNAMVCIAKSHLSGDQPSKNENGSQQPAQTLVGTGTGATLESVAQTSPTPETQVLLGTISVEVFDARGQLQSIRAVLDSGSQFSYMTQKALARLGLTRTKTIRKISTLGGALFENAQGVTRAQIHGKNQIPNLSTEFVVVHRITSALPTFPVSESVRRKFAPHQLADENWARPSECHLLLGSDLFADLVSGPPKAIGDNLPRLLPTIYGNVIIGRLVDPPSPSPPQSGTSLFSMTLTEDNLAFDLQKFWENEEIPGDGQYSLKGTVVLDEATLAEQKFVQDSYRLPDGRFGVRLPFNSEPLPDLSVSRVIARKRLLNLESKFRKNPELKEAYLTFMKEYEDLGHMEISHEEAKFTIPHHSVYNRGKIRVVFDGSAGGSEGSLNDFLLPGPPLQNDLRQILLEFRTYAVAFTTDVVKMFRNIEVHPMDRPYQTILWRKDEEEPIQSYQLKTVTYGLCSSPFHAIRCMKQLQLENESEFPLASRAIKSQVYVDDFICGAQSIEDALQLQDELITVMGRGGFKLAKWASNSPPLLESVGQASPISTVDFSTADISESTKVLGLHWDVQSDHFQFSVQPRDDVSPTKRIVLSTVSRIFDPIGVISPLTVAFKMLIQKLWIAKLGWDEQIPTSLNASWLRLVSEFSELRNLRIPRRVTIAGDAQYQLIGFSDASEAAMCCVIYLRATTADQTVVSLLTSKTKVAPIKTPLTIPRLELNAALMLAKLYDSLNSFRESLGDKWLPPILYTDSMVVLAWISKIPSTHLRVFVGNRVTLIRQLTPCEAWRHISGELNPADLGSRGLSPRQILNNDFWFKGPPFLVQPSSFWPPATPVDGHLSIPELKAALVSSPVTLLSYDNTSHLVDWMGRFSNYRMLLRVVARILRIIHNKRNPSKPRKGEFLLVEIVQAFKACVQATQLYHFLKGDPNNFQKVKEDFRSLSPFLDGQEVIRVGGRIQMAPVQYEQRHPVLLPTRSKFAILLVEYYHTALMHPPPSLLHALIQRRAWIPQARRIVRTVTRKCVSCFSARASAVIPRMGNLPDYRLSASRAFINVGLDFAGPFTHKTSLLRKAVLSKMYFCVFVCMTTKAVHLEAVTDLTSRAFLAAFARFMSRRGKPAQVFSDNGGNFLGAARELKELYAWLRDVETQNEIARGTTEQGIAWFFNPPYSPHFGGLWEAAVRSVKYYIRSSVGDTPLTFEEFSTLLAQVEALLNSRPLSPLSDSPEDFDYLSPGHFLIGAPLLAPPERSILDQKVNHLQRWQLVKRAYQQIWSRFYTEYLGTLQKRTKWTADKPSLQVGDLVLIKLPNTQPCHWPTARIIQVHPGSDNQTRVVTIQAPTGIYKRTVANLVPLLPLNEATREIPDVIPAEE